MVDATSLFGWYASYRRRILSKLAPVSCQESVLKSLISRGTQTRFGKDHDFKSIKTVSDFQSSVPLRSYDQFWTTYWKEPFPRLRDCTWQGTIPYFPVSSGTSTGTTKYIPCSNEMIASNKKAGLDLIVHHLTNNPKSRVLGGKSFVLGGSTDLVEQAPGIWSGDLSGIATKTFPWWVKSRSFPDEKLALLKNWEEKIGLLAESCLKEDIRMISGVPSWLLILFDRLFTLRPDAKGKLTKLFPNLELVVHGGVGFAPYYDQFISLLEGSRAELREVYPASEGFIATADRGYDQGLRMNLDNGIFYEFIPVEELGNERPTRHWIKNVEHDVNYAIALTTCAGLWAYTLGDTVKFVDTTTPRLKVTGRTSYFLSAFGEHLIGEEIEDAISTAAHGIGHKATDFSVGALYPEKSGDLGGHLYVVEFSEAVSDTEKLKLFISTIDSHLCKRNEDYEAHRANGVGLNPPKLLVVEHGTFAAWMKSRGKLGGQNKVPRIINDTTLFSNLRSFAKDRVLAYLP